MAGASGYAGGEVLRLLLGAPRGRDRRADGGRQRGHAARARTSRTCCRWPTGCSSRPTVGDARRPRRRLPRAAARPVGRARRAARRRRARRSTAAPTTGSTDPAAWTRSTAARTPAPGPTACRSCPAPATRCAAPAGSRCPAATRPRSRSRSSPALAAGPGRARASWSSPPPARPAPARSLKPHLLGAEVMGALSRVRRRAASTGTPPRSSRTSPRPPAAGRRLASPRSWRRCRAASSPPAPRGPRRRRPTAEVARGLREGLRRRAVRAPAARRAVAAAPRRRSAPTPCTCRSTVDERRRPARRRRRHRQPHQGHRRAAPCSA